MTLERLFEYQPPRWRQTKGEAWVHSLLPLCLLMRALSDEIQWELLQWWQPPWKSHFHQYSRRPYSAGCILFSFVSFRYLFAIIHSVLWIFQKFDQLLIYPWGCSPCAFGGWVNSIVRYLIHSSDILITGTQTSKQTDKNECTANFLSSNR